MTFRVDTPVLPSTVVAADGWSPSSWTSKPVLQDVDYPDQAHLNRVLEKIGRLPPMVAPGEVQQTTMASRIAITPYCGRTKLLNHAYGRRRFYADNFF